jgi:hypothetical protein
MRAASLVGCVHAAAHEFQPVPAICQSAVLVVELMCVVARLPLSHARPHARATAAAVRFDLWSTPL